MSPVFCEIQKQKLLPLGNTLLTSIVNCRRQPLDSMLKINHVKTIKYGK